MTPTHRDGLTGLYNRRALEEHMGRRTGEPLSVVMLDLDNLKQLNDHLGHREGDRCLREAALAWTAEVRGGDVIARFGDDEFLVAMPACMIERAREVAERLRNLTPSRLTASAGVAEWHGTQDMQSLLACVDGALYQAKAAGRNQTVVVCC